MNLCKFVNEKLNDGKTVRILFDKDGHITLKGDNMKLTWIKFDWIMIKDSDNSANDSVFNPNKVIVVKEINNEVYM